MPSQNTRDRLLDVAEDLIQRRGLNGMSFQDLSDAVGIRKASVHHHFASKSEMVDALLVRFVARFNTCADEILASRVSGKTKLKRYCGLFIATLEGCGNDKSCLCGMLMSDWLSLNESCQQKIRSFLQSSTTALENILAEGTKDGSLQVQGLTKTTASMILATLEGGLMVARCDGGPKRLCEIVSRLTQMLSA